MAEHESGELIYDIPAAVKGQAAIDPDTYEQMYQRSIQDPEGFWAEQADSFVSWFKNGTASWSGIFMRLRPSGFWAAS